MRSANLTPAAEALREPTIATIGCASAASLPRTRDQRRRVVDHAQPRRIVRLAQRDQRDAEPARGRELALGLVARADAAPALARRRGAPARAGRRARRARRRND